MSDEFIDAILDEWSEALDAYLIDQDIPALRRDLWRTAVNLYEVNAPAEVFDELRSDALKIGLRPFAIGKTIASARARASR